MTPKMWAFGTLKHEEVHWVSSGSLCPNLQSCQHFTHVCTHQPPRCSPRISTLPQGAQQPRALGRPLSSGVPRPWSSTESPLVNSPGASRCASLHVCVCVWRCVHARVCTYVHLCVCVCVAFLLFPAWGWVCVTWYTMPGSSCVLRSCLLSR